MRIAMLPGMTGQGENAVLNWLDVVILVILAGQARSGLRRGFLVGVMELLGIVISTAVPFVTYIPAGRLIEHWGVAHIFSGAVAFLGIWFITLNLYFMVARVFSHMIPGFIHKSLPNRVLGLVTSLVKGVIMIALTMAIIASLPVPPISQETMDHSVVARYMLDGANVVAVHASDIFGDAVQAVLKPRMIEPHDGEMVELHFHVENPKIDAGAEQEMLKLVNRERVRHGLRPLVMDAKLRRVARMYSTHMFKKGYFAHNSPDGATPFQRMKHGGVRYLTAGENLALAPTVKFAHSGLIKSPGHRANILNKSYHRVGIGAARSTHHGIMFTQDFAN